MIRFTEKIALNNLRANRKLTVPYIVAGAALSAIFFMMLVIATYKGSKDMSNLLIVFHFGYAILCLFAIGFLTYGNKFLMKRRRREFALYSTWGMKKHTMAAIIFWETLFTYLISTLAGMLLGYAMALFGLFTLRKLIDPGAVIKLGFPVSGVVATLIVFGVIYMITALLAYGSIRKAEPRELMQEEKSVEKPINHPLLGGVISLAFLIGGIALSWMPLKGSVVIPQFFSAVVLVMIGISLFFRYFIYMLLKKIDSSDGKYGKPALFLSATKLLSRFRKAAGDMASISILSTMVMVTIIATASIFASSHAAIDKFFPKDFRVIFSGKTDVVSELQGIYKNDGITPEDETVYRYRQTNMVRQLDKKSETIDVSEDASSSVITRGNVVPCYVDIMSRDEAENVFGHSFPPLGKKEAYYVGSLKHAKRLKTETGTWRFKELHGEKQVLPGFLASGVNYAENLVVIVDDDETAEAAANVSPDGYGTFENVVDYSANIGKDGEKVVSDLKEALNYQNEDPSGIQYKYETQKMIISCFSVLFFLGITMSLGFLLGAILIMYFNQITEGESDREQYAILNRVGVEKSLVKKTINGQLLVLFFLPLAVAALVTFAGLPNLSSILSGILPIDKTIFIMVSLIVVAAFALLYRVIYAATNRAYRSIIDA